MANVLVEKKLQGYGNKKLLVFLLFLIFIPTASASVIINEIMPQGFEWIEVYNPESLSLDLSNWTIQDESTNNPDTITCHSIENCSLITNNVYFLVLGRNTNISQITNETVDYFYVDDQKIGNGLNDDGDFILLEDSYNNFTINSSYYYSSQGKSWARIQGNLEECATPTPGKENICESETNKADETEQQGQQEQQAEKQETDRETKETTYGETSYSFLDIPASIKSCENFSFTVKIENNKNLEQNFEVWSYVYRGSKCYSCYGNKTRESNKQEAAVQSHSYKEIEIYDEINASSGDYKMKVKILKRGLKTPKEFTFNITVLADEYEETAENNSQLVQESGNETKNFLNVESSNISSITGKVVYESKSEEVKEKGVWLLAFLLMAMIVYLILRKQ